MTREPVKRGANLTEWLPHRILAGYARDLARPAAGLAVASAFRYGWTDTSSHTVVMVKTTEWPEAGVVMIAQPRLPLEETYVTCRTYEEVATAIRDMIIRGAPAIGVAAAM